ncbi:Putative 4'-phosphopantetheinyl transferase domain-containing protein [Septoria linicola]|uniref:holo-[acyl-carrier-protein] synthase n=1 Tax=Septoria linicola TaxID=215465 RepID=A0A9Q9AU92_9PEZI|nr:putative 4'-phosphopantetheinyl transferase domain-containing protein [Septoria linicola]USW52630.1 Putative 4'-phosphopantetheinyl transferase domain-containing protein [Septoria linicola]
MATGLISSRKRGPSLSQRLPHALTTHLPDISSLMTGLANSLSAHSSHLESASEKGDITCWFLDTRSLWPGARSGQDIWNAPQAADAMSLISVSEQKTITGKMFIQDAKMSLGSALLKRLFISQALDIPWSKVRLARKGDPKHGKPCAVDEVGRPIEGIDFNVSHQAGLVALIGWNGKKRHRYAPNGSIEGFISPNTNFEPDVMVGVDIVCVNERDDYRTIDQEGLDGWVDIYDFVFSDEERWTMKYDVDYITLLDGTHLGREELGRHDREIKRNKQISLTTPSGRDVTFNSDLLVEAKLRRFYTFFCYKEAYIKLAGEALLAPWLKQLEFFNVRSPKPGVPARCSTHGQWGEQVDDVEVHMNGQEVVDVRMKIQAFEESFMVSTAIQGDIQGMKVPGFTKLDLRSEVLSYAHKHLDVSPSERR